MIDEKKLLEELREWKTQMAVAAQYDPYGENLEALLELVINRVEGLPNVDQWIPIEEKKPEIGQLINVCFDHGTPDDSQRDTLIYTGETTGFGWEMDQEIVAWQPFPDPYIPPKKLPEEWIERTIERFERVE